MKSYKIDLDITISQLAENMNPSQIIDMIEELYDELTWTHKLTMIQNLMTDDHEADIVNIIASLIPEFSEKGINYIKDTITDYLDENN